MPTNFARYAELRQRVLTAAMMLLVVNLVGVIGYQLIEGWSFLDALFMTVITESTIGYGETKPLSDAGRVFTIILIFLSLGLVSYAISVLFSFAVGGEFKRIIQGHRMDNAIQKLTDHIIICGAGNTGRYIVDEFRKVRVPFVIIDRDPEVIESLNKQAGVLTILADATEDTALLAAGITRARGLVSTLNDDKENVFVVLGARSMNPNLRIVSEVVNAENTEKLRKAGATEIVSPHATGGLRLASVMIRPTVVSFLDQMLRTTEEGGQVLRVSEEPVSRMPRWLGKTLEEAAIESRTGLLILAIRESAGPYRFNPGRQTVLRAGDVLIVMGPMAQIELLEKER